MSDVFGQMHQSCAPLSSLAPFKFWHSTAELRPDMVESSEELGLWMISVDVAAFPLPDRLRDENHANLSRAANLHGDTASVDRSQSHGADGWWTVSDVNRAQFPEWCMPWSGVSVPVEIGTCRPGQLADRLMQYGACMRWPYGSTVAVIIATNALRWKARMFEEGHDD